MIETYDTGSFYCVDIPEHLVEDVLEICTTS